MDTIFRISNIIYNRSESFSEKEYVDLMTSLYNINKMLDKKKLTHMLPRDCIPSPWLQTFLLRERQRSRSCSPGGERKTTKTRVDILKAKKRAPQVAATTASSSSSSSSSSFSHPLSSSVYGLDNVQHPPCQGKTCPLCNYIGRDPQIFHMYQRELEKKTEDELMQLCEVYDLDTGGTKREIIFRLLFTLKPEDLDSVLCWVDVTPGMTSSGILEN